jgi:predicted  nucleic acid-binding Zn-ribbon protein
MSRKHKSHLRLYLSIWLLALAGFGWLQRVAIYDAWRLRGYTPPASIAALAANTTMNEKGRHLFYVYHPSLEEKGAFNQHCSSNGEQTIVLGCYISTSGIYLFNINDERLNGIKEVTAAHEMLHAAYDRLGNTEKSRIDQLLNGTFKNLNDERINKTITSYEQSGADTVNELHSILGTEVRELPAELEEYYKKYFTDRSKIVDYSEKYEAVFSSYQQQIKDLQEQINSLKDEISGQLADIQHEEASLEAEGQRMENLKASGKYTEYNAAVEPYNSRLRRLRSLISSYNSNVNKYNELIETYNSLASVTKDLYKAIDSHSAPEAL